MLSEPADGRLRAAELDAALQLFDETTRALESRARRLEEVLTVKQAALQEANARLQQKVVELDDLQAYLNLVLGAVASGVVAVDTSGRITACNPAGRFVLVADRDEDVVGRAYEELMPQSTVARVLASGQSVGPWERSHPGYDGNDRRLSGRSTPIIAADGTCLGAVEVFEDVTEVRRLESQLQRAERLRSLGEMAAGVAHEIRNPLNGIEGFASLLQRDLPPASSQARYAQAVIDGVRHLNGTVTGLLAFTAPRQPHRRRLAVQELCRSSLDLLDGAHLPDRRGADHEAPPIVPVPITLSCQDPELKAVCDAGQLRQVLVNLIQNACQILRQHQVPAPQVVVQAGVEAGEVVICVDDNGPGVPSEERQRIFMPFHSRRDEGTGLGLAIAHTLVGLHGGRLEVGDSPLGGARFRISLPLDPVSGSRS